MNAQYQIPENGYTENDARKEVAQIQFTPERERNYEPYRFLMNIRDAVESFRETAIAIEQRHGRYKEVRGVRLPGKLPARHPEKILKSLVDEEWKIGGDLYGKDAGYRFGLDARLTAVNQADWYHTAPNPADPEHPHVVHFVVTPTKLEMLLTDGHAYAPTIQDIQRFVHGAYHYLYNIRELYPLDATIDDLLQEIAADIPDDLNELMPQNHAGISRDDYRLAA